VNDLTHNKHCGFQIITARDINCIRTKGVIKEIKKRVGEAKVYISVDIDVLDPAFAPGTSFIFPL
jgi:agmatinase